MKLLKGLVNQGLMSFVSAVFFSCTLIAAHADDTEIFFGGEASDHALISPNILFIIDNSGSMSWGINDGTNRNTDECSEVVVQAAYGFHLGNSHEGWPDSNA